MSWPARPFDAERGDETPQRAGGWLCAHVRHHHRRPSRRRREGRWPTWRPGPVLLVAGVYLSYLECCNEHDVDRMASFYMELPAAMSLVEAGLETRDEPAVDDELGARDVAAGVACQEDRQPCQLARLAPAA